LRMVSSWEGGRSRHQGPGHPGHRLDDIIVDQREFLNRFIVFLNC
jgi:hypothetical protein